MQDIPFGQLLVLIVFILFPLISVLLKRMQRRFERQPPRQELPRQPSPRTFEKPPPVEFTPSASERLPAPERTGTRPRPRRQLRNKTFFRGHRDLRRAIVLMTVLGPCRAVSSPDAEQRQLPQ
jgi:hypothetical protein